MRALRYLRVFSFSKENSRDKARERRKEQEDGHTRSNSERHRNDRSYFIGEKP
jgi:hypothetical protein